MRELETPCSLDASCGEYGDCISCGAETHAHAHVSTPSPRAAGAHDDHMRWVLARADVACYQEGDSDVDVAC